MANIQISLESPITTDFTVFAKDQVLTAGQLNRAASYSDDQARLTRVNLLGVGIVCGLRVSLLADGTFQVSRGVGVTSDGDIMYFEADTVFSQYKIYDSTNPVYSPFYNGSAMITVYQLLGATAAGATPDPAAVALSQFTAETKASLDDMVAVLFMESFVNAGTVCTGTDCDNMGQACTNTIKLLLVEKASVGALLSAPATPASAASVLTAIVADRVKISSAISTYALLSAAYISTCANILAKLSTALPKIYPACSSFISHAFPSDPSGGWISLLNGYASSYSSNATGVQYYYDFLKDLVETYNQFIGLLFGQNTVCCPAISVFPKHLILGDVSGNLDEYRTLFYPSPAVAYCCGEDVGHAIFLLQKIDVLIRSFKVPPSTPNAARITPSGMEDLSLEARAIPYYYNWTSEVQIQEFWSYDLHEKGLDARIYSYNANLYEGTSDPFDYQIGRFPFFRVEGHLGQKIGDVQAYLNALVQSMNVPITVRKILLWADPLKIVRDPGIQYTNLHDFHYLVRQDTVYRMKDVATFSDNFNTVASAAVADPTRGIPNAPLDGNTLSVTDTASQKDAAIDTDAQLVQSRLNSTYSSYLSDNSWEAAHSRVIQNAAQFKSSLGSIVNTQFSTPFDSAIASSHPQWLEWLDQIIAANQKMEDEKLQFSNFILQHPGVEHLGGVPRGGTLILLYDDSQIVVGDFMLPYYWPDTSRVEPPQVPLTPPASKPDWIVNNGLTLNQSRAGYVSSYVGSRLTDFQTNVLAPAVKTNTDIQSSYLTGLKESVAMYTSGARPTTASGDPAYKDAYLKETVVNTEAQRQMVVLLQAKAKDTTLTPAQQAQYAAQAVTAQGNLSQAVQSTLSYISTASLPVVPGSDAYDATMRVSSAVPLISDPTASKNFATALSGLASTAADPTYKAYLGNISIIKPALVTTNILVPKAATPTG